MNEHHQWVRPLIYSIGGLAVGCFVVLLAWIVVTILQVANDVKDLSENTDDTTTEIREAQKGSRSLLDFLKDCTEPRGKCYRESAARQAEQAGALNAAIVAARFCADQELPDVYKLDDLTDCVVKILNGKGHK